MHEKPPQNNENNLEQMIVNKTIELIEQNPNIVFLVSGNGNVLGNRGKDSGQEDYYFDKKQQKLIALNETTAKMYQHLDLPVNEIPRKERDLILYKPYWNIFSAYAHKSNNEKVTRPFTVASVRFPFVPIDKNNPFTDEKGRPGVHLSFGVMFPNNKPEIFDTFGEEKIKEYLKNPNTQEAKKFLSDVFLACAEKYIPQYLNFYLEQFNLHTKNQEKK